LRVQAGVLAMLTSVRQTHRDRFLCRFDLRFALLLQAHPEVNDGLQRQLAQPRHNQVDVVDGQVGQGDLDVVHVRLG
jgi:hypothetical protein